MSKSPITLVIDSSTPTLFLGLIQGENVLGYLVEKLDRLQSEWMVPKLILLLSNHHLSLAAIEAVVVGDGPGSFTGVRLALTFVKILGLMKPINIYPISSLHLLSGQLPTITWMDARGGRRYLGVYQGFQCLMAPQIIFEKDLHQIEKRFPSASWLAVEMALQQPETILLHVMKMLPHLQPIADVQTLNPRYLKDLQK